MRRERGGCVTQSGQMTNREERISEMTRQYEIPQLTVKEAWKRVKKNKGAAGIDGVTIEDFERELEKNLYKIWNRMTSGSYFPPPVRIVEIPKSSGGKRTLGIATVADRVAQTVAKIYLEPEVEPGFHPDSYGYRPKRSQHDAIASARKRCWQYDWAVEIDIVGYFDNIDHELLLGLLRERTTLKWLLLYVERWLKVGFLGPDSTTVSSDKGAAQGSVLSPLLSNIFLDQVFDKWMTENFANVPFERFADDLVCHCHSLEEAEEIRDAVAARLTEWKLEMHVGKTRIVYCKDNNRTGGHRPINLRFLGYEFKPRRAANSQDGSIFTSYLPAISDKAKLSIHEQLREWNLMKRTQHTLEDLRKDHNGTIRGWLNYYGKFCGSAMVPVLDHIDELLVHWVKRKYKSLRTKTRARHWLKGVKARQPDLFAHWSWSSRPVG